MKTALLSYLGFEGEALYAEYKEPNESEDVFQEYYKQLRTMVPALKENQRLIDYIATPPRCFQVLLKLDPIILARAICCWDGHRQAQILAYLPYSRVKRIVQEMNGIPQEKRCEVAVLSQESLLRSIDKLIESGEIIA